jgi:aldose 1-epimerase
MTIRVADYGATLQAVLVPDSAGVLRDVVLGHDSLTEYIASDAYFGAIVGRFANRVRRGEVMIDGKVYLLDLNEGVHHLHGGLKGFDRQVWQGSVEHNALVFRRTSLDGEMGYPGKLQAKVTYLLSSRGQLVIELEAWTNAPTLCNLAHHGYWNLAGSGTVLDHVLTSPAPFLLATDVDLLPTGEVLSVAGTGCDFRTGRRIGQDFDAVSLRPNEGRTAGVGYDHTLVLGPCDLDGLRLAARLFSPETGLGFNLHTNAPALQVYSGGDLGHYLTGKGQVQFVQAAGIALETQGFPSATEFAHFPPTSLDPGKTYKHVMEVRFFHSAI